MRTRTGRTWDRRTRTKVLVLSALLALVAAACSGRQEVGGNGNGGTPGTGPVITSVAGAGEGVGLDGDGVLATEAKLYGPGAVIGDAEGLLFYGDEFGDVVTQRIRMVDRPVP